MNIKTVQAVSDSLPYCIKGKVTVVIDVFRATSVITTALANGAKKVITTKDIETARHLYQQYDSENCLLGGERHMHKIEGFHLGNSPQSYSTDMIRNKTIILTTTNGTRAVHTCQSADAIYICSLLNCLSVAKALVPFKDVVILCAGSQNTFSLEDAYCAGKLINQLSSLTDVYCDDMSNAFQKLYDSNRHQMHSFLMQGKAGRSLIENQYHNDVMFCMQNDIYAVTPIYQDGCFSAQ